MKNRPTLSIWLVSLTLLALAITAATLLTTGVSRRAAAAPQLIALTTRRAGGWG